MEKLMKRYALTRQGAKDFIICTIVTTIQNIMLMAPVAILYYITSDLISGSISKSNNVAYIIACVIMLVVMGIVFYFQYNTSFFSTYIESEHRRINLAEKLRELPLSFFEKKDLSDLTSTILGDCTVLEHNFSHVMPQFFGSIISTIIIAVSLFSLTVSLQCSLVGASNSTYYSGLFRKSTKRHIKKKKKSCACTGRRLSGVS